MYKYHSPQGLIECDTAEELKKAVELFRVETKVQTDTQVESRAYGALRKPFKTDTFL